MPDTLTYDFAETAFTILDVEAGERIHHRVDMSGQLHLNASRDSSRDHVVVRVVQFDGRRTSLAGGDSITATELDVNGPAKLLVTRTGTVEVQERPAISDAFRRILIPDHLLRRLFIPLPATVITVGEKWVDTTETTTATDGMTYRTVDKFFGTYTTDSTVGGRIVKVIQSTTLRTITASGTIEGSSASHQLVGHVLTRTLWDDELGTITYREETYELKGHYQLLSLGTSRPGLTLRGRFRLQAVRR